jgi:hypothetical protein
MQCGVVLIGRVRCCGALPNLRVVQQSGSPAHVRRFWGSCAPLASPGFNPTAPCGVAQCEARHRAIAFLPVRPSFLHIRPKFPTSRPPRPPYSVPAGLFIALLPPSSLLSHYNHTTATTQRLHPTTTAPHCQYPVASNGCGNFA